MNENLINNLKSIAELDADDESLQGIEFCIKFVHQPNFFEIVQELLSNQDISADIFVLLLRLSYIYILKEFQNIPVSIIENYSEFILKLIQTKQNEFKELEYRAQKVIVDILSSNYAICIICCFAYYKSESIMDFSFNLLKDFQIEVEEITDSFFIRIPSSIFELLIKLNSELSPNGFIFLAKKSLLHLVHMINKETSKEKTFPSLFGEFYQQLIEICIRIQNYFNEFNVSFDLIFTDSLANQFENFIDHDMMKSIIYISNLITNSSFIASKTVSHNISRIFTSYSSKILTSEDDEFKISYLDALVNYFKKTKSQLIEPLKSNIINFTKDCIQANKYIYVNTLLSFWTLFNQEEVVFNLIGYIFKFIDFLEENETIEQIFRNKEVIFSDFFILFSNITKNYDKRFYIPMQNLFVQHHMRYFTLIKNDSMQKLHIEEQHLTSFIKIAALYLTKQKEFENMDQKSLLFNIFKVNEKIIQNKEKMLDQSILVFWILESCRLILESSYISGSDINIKKYNINRKIKNLAGLKDVNEEAYNTFRISCFKVADFALANFENPDIKKVSMEILIKMKETQEFVELSTEWFNVPRDYVFNELLITETTNFLAHIFGNYMKKAEQTTTSLLEHIDGLLDEKEITRFLLYLISLCKCGNFYNQFMIFYDWFKGKKLEFISRITEQVHLNLVYKLYETILEPVDHKFSFTNGSDIVGVYISILIFTRKYFNFGFELNDESIVANSISLLLKLLKSNIIDIKTLKYFKNNDFDEFWTEIVNRFNSIEFIGTLTDQTQAILYDLMIFITNESNLDYFIEISLPFIKMASKLMRILLLTPKTELNLKSMQLFSNLIKLPNSDRIKSIQKMEAEVWNEILYRRRFNISLLHPSISYLMIVKKSNYYVEKGNEAIAHLPEIQRGNIIQILNSLKQKASVGKECSILDELTKWRVMYQEAYLTAPIK